MILNLLNNPQITYYLEIILVFILIFLFIFLVLRKIIFTIFSYIFVNTVFEKISKDYILLTPQKSVIKKKIDKYFNEKELIPSPLPEEFPYYDIKILVKNSYINIVEIEGFLIKFIMIKKGYVFTFNLLNRAILSPNLIFITYDNGSIIHNLLENSDFSSQIKTIPELTENSIKKNLFFLTEDRKLILIPYQFEAKYKSIILWYGFESRYITEFLESTSIPIKLKIANFSYNSNIANLENKVFYKDEKTKHIFVKDIKWKKFSFKNLDWEIGKIAEADLFFYYKYFFIEYFKKLDNYLKEWDKRDIKSLNSELKGIRDTLNKQILKYHGTIISEENFYDIIPPEIKNLLDFSHSLMERLETFNNYKKNIRLIDYYVFIYKIILFVIENNYYNLVNEILQEILKSLIDETFYNAEEIFLSEIFVDYSFESYIRTDVKNPSYCIDYKIHRDFLNLFYAIINEEYFPRIKMYATKITIELQSSLSEDIQEFIDIFSKFFNYHSKIKIKAEDDVIDIYF